jgi:cbb3-type cytochrome oxidase subunit 3
LWALIAVGLISAAVYYSLLRPALRGRERKSPL